MDGPRSLIWDQSENRLHAQKGLSPRSSGVDDDRRSSTSATRTPCGAAMSPPSGDGRTRPHRRLRRGDLPGPRPAAAHISRAGVLVKVGRFDEALAGYERALRLAPRDVAALGGRAEALARPAAGGRGRRVRLPRRHPRGGRPDGRGLRHRPARPRAGRIEGPPPPHRGPQSSSMLAADGRGGPAGRALKALEALAPPPRDGAARAPATGRRGREAPAMAADRRAHGRRSRPSEAPPERRPGRHCRRAAASNEEALDLGDLAAATAVPRGGPPAQRVARASAGCGGPDAGRRGGGHDRRPAPVVLSTCSPPWPLAADTAPAAT